MARVTITKNPLDFAGLQNLGEEIGSEWVSREIEMFETSGSKEKAWRPTQKPQTMAILKKLAETGKSTKQSHVEKYFREKKTLIDTGLLRNSITFRVVENSPDKELSVKVGTNLTYAEKLQLGGVEQLAINQNIREGIESLLNVRTNIERYRFLRKFLTEDNYKLKIFPRAIFIFDSILKGRINMIFQRWIRNQNQRGV